MDQQVCAAVSASTLSTVAAYFWGFSVLGAISNGIAVTAVNEGLSADPFNIALAAFLAACAVYYGATTYAAATTAYYAVNSASFPGAFAVCAAYGTLIVSSAFQVAGNGFILCHCALASTFTGLTSASAAGFGVGLCYASTTTNFGRGTLAAAAVCLAITVTADVVAASGGVAAVFHGAHVTAYYLLSVAFFIGTVAPGVAALYTFTSGLYSAARVFTVIFATYFAISLTPLSGYVTFTLPIVAVYIVGVYFADTPNDAVSAHFVQIYVINTGVIVAMNGLSAATDAISAHVTSYYVGFAFILLLVVYVIGVYVAGFYAVYPVVRADEMIDYRLVESINMRVRDKGEYKITTKISKIFRFY